MPSPVVAVIVTSYQRPGHLERCLASIRAQRGVAGRFEVAVADDGSTDDTAEVVAAFREAVDFPVAWTTHPHRGFHVARSRNEGVRATRAPYLLFIDGDCVLPPRHLARHLAARRPRTVRFTEAARLRRADSEAITVEGILAGRLRPRVPTAERRRRKHLIRRSFLDNLARHPTRPVLYGNDMALARADYERVNGHDECFRGWGGEDVDLGRRLRRDGCRIRTLLHRTRSWHLWHPEEPTADPDGASRARTRALLESERPVRCVAGLVR